MHWNMACLASAFLPLLELNHTAEESQTILRNALEQFPIQYAQTWQDLFRKKLGLHSSEEGDIRLIEQLLQAMHDSRVDFTNFFRSISKIKKDQPVTQTSLRDQFIDRNAIDQWFSEYLQRLQREVLSDDARSTAMNLINPKYILRNHLAQAAIEKAQAKDFAETHQLLKILSHPFDEQVEHEAYAQAPPIDMRKIEVSCSS
jgi:uncharacterized protein YdiU (UPF0061 family)